MLGQYMMTVERFHRAMTFWTQKFVSYYVALIHSKYIINYNAYMSLYENELLN